MNIKQTEHPKETISPHKFMAEINIRVYNNQFVINYVNTENINTAVINNAFECILRDFQNEETNKISDKLQ